MKNKTRCPTIESCWHSLPSPGQDCPLDDERIGSSEDILFLAVVLKHFKPPVRWLKRFVMQGTRQGRYLLERVDGVLLSPVTLEETNPEEGWIPAQTIGTKSLRQRMREYFYAYRQFLLGDGLETVIINGRTLTKEGERQYGYAEFMESLRWPVAKTDDPILNHLPELNFFEFDVARGASSLNAICPLDGSVRPLLFEIVSPEWTWDHLCGRHWAFALCPSCLGKFAARLVSMN